MLQTQQPVLQRFWNPVIPSDQVKDQPVGLTYFGQDIVLWRDSAGAISALEDRCQHRTARLSAGWVDGDALVCGYHGWNYAADGKCIKIPQQPELAPKLCSARARATRFHAEDRYGYVWVCLAAEPLAGIPEFEEDGAPGFRRIPQFYEVWRTSGLRLMENSFDNAHFSFVHRASFGQSHQTIPASLKLTPTDFGFLFETKAPVNNPPEQKKLLGMEDDQTVRHMRNKWYMPFVRKLHITYPNGLVHAIVTCATPIDDASIQVCQWAYRNDTEADAPAAEVVAFDRQVTGEDKAVLATTDWDASLDLASGEEKHMPSDQPGMMMRKMLIALLREHGETEVRLSGRAAARIQKNSQAA